MTQKKQMTNPLGTDRISTLVARFAVPSIIATLVSAVYNIADQLFIGNAVGTLGNAATNVAFPLRFLHALRSGFCLPLILYRPSEITLRQRLEQWTEFRRTENCRTASWRMA